MIRQCSAEDFDRIYEVINDAAAAYKRVIPADCWNDPYMSTEELQHEIDHSVVFWGCYGTEGLVAVMGLQQMQDVALIRHAYTLTNHQRRGLGGRLLTHLRLQSERPLLVGTWKAATWAIRFYQRHGFRLVSEAEKAGLLRKYWTVPARQIEESVVLADPRWFVSR